MPEQDQGSINSGADNSSADLWDKEGPDSEIGGMHGSSIDAKTPRRTAPAQKKPVDTNKKRNFPENTNGDTQQTIPEEVRKETSTTTTVPATRTLDLIPNSLFTEAEQIVRTQMIAELGQEAIFKEIDEKGNAAIYIYFPKTSTGLPINTNPVTYNMKYLADIQEQPEQRIVKKSVAIEVKQVKVDTEDEMEERTSVVVEFANLFMGRGLK